MQEKAKIELLNQHCALEHWEVEREDVGRIVTEVVPKMIKTLYGRELTPLLSYVTTHVIRYVACEFNIHIVMDSLDNEDVILKSMNLPSIKE